MITLQVSRWELVTTGYLDPNGYKRGKGQVTRQIEFCCKMCMSKAKPSGLIYALMCEKESLCNFPKSVGNQKSIRKPCLYCP